MTLVEFSNSGLFLVFLIFSRVGSAFMFIPAIGETSVPSMVKIIFAVAVSLLIFSSMPNNILFPDSVVSIVVLLVGEISIGVMIGLVTKFIISAVHVFGLVMATQSGLASAMLFDPAQATQGSLFGNFFTILAIMLILSLDLHLVIISGLADTYKHLPIGGFTRHFESFSELIIRSASNAFITGVKMSLPFLVVSLMLFLGVGILAKLIPQLQVFSLIFPIQIIINVLVFIFILSSLSMWFVDYYQEQLSQIYGS
ncbi:flagellar biosynthetic protein FliR [Holosporaceae bacterium 'Namur']|nr:flagellar biosynthetic protein FliR [Holosporaceae bacterium 'Namur']